MTLALTGASVGGMVVVPGLVVSIQRVGFGVAMAASGAILLAVLLPLVAFVIKPAPADPGLAGGREARPDWVTASVPAREWTGREALRAPLFWTIAGPFALALAAQVGFLVHQISVLTPALGEARAALAVSATTVAALIGRLGFGLLADQWDPRVLSAWNIGIQALWALAVLEVLAIAGVLWGRALRGARAPVPLG